MICSTIGLGADSFQSIYVTGGAEVSEVYGGLNDTEPIFYKTQTISGTAPISFKALGTPLTGWRIAGQMTQTGTPTESDPIYPEECGDLVTSGEYAGKYAIPITCGGETKTVYLDEPLRKIGNYQDTVDADGTVTRCVVKKVLDGSENWNTVSPGSNTYFRNTVGAYGDIVSLICLCSHFENAAITTTTTYVGISAFNSAGSNVAAIGIRPTNVQSMSAQQFKTFLAAKFSAGTPVTVWYVRTTPTTAAISAPEVPTVAGENTLSIGTTLQPSQVSITGHIKPVTS